MVGFTHTPGDNRDSRKTAERESSNHPFLLAGIASPLNVPSLPAWILEHSAILYHVLRKP